MTISDRYYLLDVDHMSVYDTLNAARDARARRGAGSIMAAPDTAHATRMAAYARENAGVALACGELDIP